MLNRWYMPLVFMATLVAGCAVAQDSVKISLQWPLSCSLGKDCFIGAYPDVTAGTDPTKPTDYRCGGRTLPGLEGLQVIFKDWRTALAEQPVYPVAEGKVLEIADGFVDGDIQVEGKACGNSVVVDHGGWQSRYCYLKQASVLVKAGQAVNGRDVLGLVGQSGAAVEPMLALFVTKDSMAYDPFLKQAITHGGCNKLADQGDWGTAIHYTDAAVMGMGFAPRVVNHLEVKANGVLTQRDLTTASPYLVAWARVQNVSAGDEEIFTLTSPSGQVVQERRLKLPGESADYMSFVFVKADKKKLEAGDWLSHYQLKRGGRIVVQKNNNIYLE